MKLIRTSLWLKLPKSLTLCDNSLEISTRPSYLKSLLKSYCLTRMKDYLFCLQRIWIRVRLIPRHVLLSNLPSQIRWYNYFCAYRTLIISQKARTKNCLNSVKISYEGSSCYSTVHQHCTMQPLWVHSSKLLSLSQQTEDRQTTLWWLNLPLQSKRIGCSTLNMTAEHLKTLA
jgi:hypothetical protein